MSAKLATPTSAVRVTVEADNEDSAPEEEVEDIGSASTSSASEAEVELKQGGAAQKKLGKKRKSEASGAAGLANVLRGLLSKPLPVAGACPILAKALTDRQRFSPAAADNSEDGEIEHSGDMDDISATRRRRLIAERRRWLCTGRVKPSGGGGGREAERELERIACRGVVQLFNAVRAQQRTLEARLAGKSEAGRQRVLSSLSKADFLDMLAGRRKRSQAEPVEASPKVDKGKDDDESMADVEQASRKCRKQRKSWGVLSNDYLVKPTLTMKDWDKESEDEDPEHEVADIGQPMEDDD